MEDANYTRLVFVEEEDDLEFTDMTDEAGVDARLKLYINRADLVYVVQFDLRTAPDLAYDVLGSLGTYGELEDNADLGGIEDTLGYTGGVLVRIADDSTQILVEGDDEEDFEDDDEERRRRRRPPPPPPPRGKTVVVVYVVVVYVVVVYVVVPNGRKVLLLPKRDDEEKPDALCVSLL